MQYFCCRIYFVKYILGHIGFVHSCYKNLTNVKLTHVKLTLTVAKLKLPVLQFYSHRSGVLLWGVWGGGHTPSPLPSQAKVLNFAVLSFGPRILSFSFKF